MLTNFLKARRSPDIAESTFSCSREGLTIRGTEYRPIGGNLPAAIVSHGFMANQDTVRHYARHLAEIGYAAYCFDFNGGSVMGSKSTGKTTDMSVLTEVMDLEAVIDPDGLQPGRIRLCVDCRQKERAGFKAGVVLPGPLHPGRCPRRENDVRQI